MEANIYQEIEEAVLGACLIEPSTALRQVQGIWSEALFSSEFNKLIYSAIVELDKGNASIDILSVTSHLQKSGKATNDTPFRVTMLTNRVNSTNNLSHHIYILKEQNIKKELAGLGVALMTEASQDNTDALELLNSANIKLGELNTSSTRNEPFNMAMALEEHTNEVEEIRKADGGIIGTSFGVDELDKMLKGFRDKLYIIAARPGMGKSIFALQASFVSAYIGKPTIFISLEMPVKEVMDRLIAHISGVDASIVEEGNYDDRSNTGHRIAEAKALILKLPLYILPASTLTVDELKAHSRRIAGKHGNNMGMIVVDYLQLMGGSGKKGQNREQEISEISRGLKNLQIEMKCPVLALSQLSRAVESRPDKKPMLSDLRESGSIEQDADCVMFLFRPEYYGIMENEEGESVKGMAEIIVAKHRGGRLGAIPSNLDRPAMKFSNWNTQSIYDTLPEPTNTISIQGNINHFEPNF